MALLKTSPEILLKIILYLDFQSVLSFQRVNYFLHQIYQDSAQLQYHVECEVAGVDDNPKCTLPVTTRLQMLRNHESAWSSRQPSVQLEKLSFPICNTDILDVAGGHCFIGLRANLDAPSWITSHPIPIHREDIIPQSSSDAWSKLFIEGLFEVGTCIDEHDLVVCFVASKVPMSEDYDFRVSLIQHSSGKPHPTAAKPTFSIFQAPGLTTDVSLQMGIVGENLVLAFVLPFQRFYFYNWKTGENKGIQPYRGHCEFTFLRHDILCHPNIGDMSLDIYHIPSSCRPGHVRCIQVLLLQKDLVQGGVDRISIGGSPNPTFEGLFPKYVPATQPFLERPEEAIMIFQFFSDGDTEVSVVVHRKYLLNLLPSGERWSGTHFVHWDDWSSGVVLFKSPQNLRFVPTGQYGQRCIVDLPLEGEDLSFHLFDFNPYRVRRAQGIDPHRSYTPLLHKAGTLPYTVTTLPQECVYNVLFMSHAGLLGIEFNDDEDYRIQVTDLSVVYFV